jgi:hypothetical protein
MTPEDEWRPHARKSAQQEASEQHEVAKSAGREREHSHNLNPFLGAVKGPLDEGPAGIFPASRTFYDARFSYGELKRFVGIGLA